MDHNASRSYILEQQFSVSVDEPKKKFSVRHVVNAFLVPHFSFQFKGARIFSFSHETARMSTHMSTHTSTYMPTHMSAHMPICTPIHMSVHIHGCIDVGRPLGWFGQLDALHVHAQPRALDCATLCACMGTGGRAGGRAGGRHVRVWVSVRK